MTTSTSLTRFPLRKRLSLWLKTSFEKVVLGREVDRLTRTVGGHIFFETLVAAARLDIFTLLARRGAMTRAAMTRELGVEEKPLRILLLGCVSLGLLVKKGERYSNSRVANLALSRDQARNILPILEWQHLINYRAMFHFADAIKANRNVGLEVFEGSENTLYGRLTHHPELELVFQRAMESISVQANELLAEYVDLSSVRLLVDVGGGNGTNIIRLARRYPALKALVFDSPSVCEIARGNIADAGLADRLGASPGDCFADNFPAGVDCVLFCHFFTIWSEERNQALLRKAYEALPSGGAAIVFNMMQDDDESGPLTSAMGSPYFLTLATGEGMLYTWSEYEAWMRAAGFSRVLRRTFVRNHGAIIGIK